MSDNQSNTPNQNSSKKSAKSLYINSGFHKLYDKLLNWYFTKKALPYWSVFFLDCLIGIASGFFVMLLFTNFRRILLHWDSALFTIFIYMVFISAIGFRLFHTYTGVVRYSSFIDLRRVGNAMALSCLIALILHYPIGWANVGLKETHHINLIVSLNGRQIIAMYVMATILMWAWRILVKSLFDISYKSENSIRTMIFGVGDWGVGLAKSIRNYKEPAYSLQGFLTKDSDYRGRMLMGVKVYIINDELPQTLKDKHIERVLISPRMRHQFRTDKQIQNILMDSGAKIYVVNNANIEFNEKDIDNISNMELKPVSLEDLLERDEIKIDMVNVGKMLTNKKILITGSAGSIGSEIVRQISDYHPSELMLIDSAETPQHDIRLMMAKKWPNIKASTVVGSIADAPRMEYIFSSFKPDYVFHAAAYKHVPMMEDNPSESVHNNIYGTMVIADLSVKYGVKKFVMLSTDKAVNPTNVMGCSKRICEIYVQSLDKAIKEGRIKGITQFVTTRFGNVLGSNGSVIPLFEKQIRAGGPVTVTDKRVIRFFMLIPEACKLVLEAGTHGQGGEIFVFDMGEQVRIADLAQNMIRLSGAKNVEITYTGLRPGEKLYEELLSTEENTMPSFHEKIRIAKVREYDYESVNKDIHDLLKIMDTYDDMQIVGKMKEIVPEFKSNNSVFQQLDHK